MTDTVLKHGDFTKLAEDYARYRPAYSETVLSALLGLMGKPVAPADAADPGNGMLSWREGSAENTNLDDESVDLLSIASSFHWADFTVAMQEFHHVLRPGGHLVALWNPRLIEANPLLLKIEDHLQSLAPDLKRVSSGRSGLTATLTDRFCASSWFEDVVYLEGRHMVDLPVDHYLGAWRSMNDVQAQLGPQRFAEFLAFMADLLNLRRWSQLPI